MSLAELQALNNYKIHPISDPAFGRYCRVLEGFEWNEALSLLADISPLPEGSVYLASSPELEALPLKAALSGSVFGGMDIQIGYCNGTTSGMDALEYHKGSEVNIADSDILLFLARAEDIEGLKLPVSKARAFLLPAGTAIELLPGTLHFAPCRTVKKGYRSLVVLPVGTNTPLPEKRPQAASEEDRLLFSRNKWLLAHPDCARLMARNALPALQGPRLEVKIDAI